MTTEKKFFKEGAKLNEVEQLMQDGKYSIPEFNEMTLQEIAKAAYKSKPQEDVMAIDVDKLNLSDMGMMCLVFNSDIPMEDKLVFTSQLYMNLNSYNEKMIYSFLDKLWYAVEGVKGLHDDVVLTTECPHCESDRIFDIFKDINELKELLSETEYYDDEVAFKVRIRTTRAYNEELGSFDILGNGEIINLYIESNEHDRFNFDYITCIPNILRKNPFKVGDKVRIIAEKNYNNKVYIVMEAEENEDQVLIKCTEDTCEFSNGCIRYIDQIEPVEE